MGMWQIWQMMAISLHQASCYTAYRNSLFLTNGKTLSDSYATAPENEWILLAHMTNYRMARYTIVYTYLSLGYTLKKIHTHTNHFIITIMFHFQTIKLYDHT